jgi:hypothetical protein
VQPFLVPSAAMIRSGPPNPLTSSAYAEDFNEVKRVGSLASTTRTTDQTEAAIFWQDHGPALWNRVMRALSASRGLDIADTARLFASANLASADGASGCWESKYQWKFWRPVTAVREAQSDGNPATEADPAWTPLFDPATPQFGPPLSTPGFPEHPSGHGCISGAIVHTLQAFFGTDKIAFSAVSNRTGRREATTGSRRRSRKSSTRACGARYPLPNGRRPGRRTRQQGRPLARKSTTSTRRLNPPNGMRGRGRRPLTHAPAQPSEHRPTPPTQRSLPFRRHSRQRPAQRRQPPHDRRLRPCVRAQRGTSQHFPQHLVGSLVHRCPTGHRRKTADDEVCGVLAVLDTTPVDSGSPPRVPDKKRSLVRVHDRPSGESPLRQDRLPAVSPPLTPHAAD